MSRKTSPAARFCTKFYLMKKGQDRSAMLIRSAVKGGPVVYQLLGEVCAGRFVPTIFEKLFSHEMALGEAAKAPFLKHASAAAFIEIHGRVFGFQFGKGEN